MSEIEQPERDTSSLATQLDTRPLPAAQLSDEVEVIVAGDIRLDIVPTLRNNTTGNTPGQWLEASTTQVIATGPVANTGLALHALGVTTRLMGKIGNDVFGQALLRLLEARAPGIASSMIIARGENSSYAITVNPAKGERMVIYAPGGNDTLSASNLRYDRLKPVSLFHVGCTPLLTHLYENNGEELAQLFKKAKEYGVTTSLDLSVTEPLISASKLDWRTLLTMVLPEVDVFLCSVDSLLMLLRRQLFDRLSSRAARSNFFDLVAPDVVSELGKLLLDLGAKIVCIPVGHRGMYICTANAAVLEQAGRVQPTKLVAWANRELWSPCFSTQIVSARGSTDATVAGFLMGLLRNMTPEAALAAASAAAACCVEAEDALSGIKSWPETLERIAAGWSRLMVNGKAKSPLDMANAGWRWHEAQEVWLGPQDVHH